MAERMKQFYKHERSFEMQSKVYFMKSQHEERQKILKNSLDNQFTQLPANYSKEVLLTERVCQQMINEFPMVNLKQINKSISRDTLGPNSQLSSNFDKQASMLTSSVLGLRQLKKLETVSNNFCKLSKSLIQRSSQMYKDEGIDQFKV